MTTKIKTFCMVNKKGIFGRRVRDFNTQNRFFEYIKKKEANYRMNKIFNDYAAKTDKESTRQLRKRFCSCRTKTKSGSFEELGPWLGQNYVTTLMEAVEEEKPYA